MVNKAIIVGNLGRDPEVKYTSGGKAIATFSVATSRKMKDGEKKTEWHNIEAWEKLAELCGQYLSKGRPVYVEGRIETETWEKDGMKKSKTKIVASDVRFLGSKEESSGEAVSEYIAPVKDKTSDVSDIPF